MGLLNYKLLSSALSQFNIKEFKGSKHNAKILEYFKAAGYPGIRTDETAWCAAFANWVLADNGLQGSGKLSARSLLKVGEKVKEPIAGDLVIFWRESPRSWKGHVGFFVKQTKSYVYCLGGNQSNRVSIAPYHKDRLLGFRRMRQADGFLKTCSCDKQPIKYELLSANRFVTPSVHLGVELVFLGELDYLTTSIQEAYIAKVEQDLADTFKLNFKVHSRRMYATEHSLEKIAMQNEKNLYEKIYRKYNDNPENITIFVVAGNSRLEGFSSVGYNSVFVDIDSYSKYSSTIAHQVGHLFGLNHIEAMTDQEKNNFGISGDLDKFNLMNNNIYGKLLSDLQIGYAHNLAITKFFT